MSLSSLIVEREVATMRQVEEALARQVIYGGDLVTNLLEVVRLDEAVLTPLLAESMHLAAAPAGELAPPPDAVRALIPAEVAVQQSIVPLEANANQLVIAVVEPLPADVRDQLGGALGLRIEEVAAPAVRVWQAVARAYGVELDRRMHRLISRLAGDRAIPSTLPALGASLAPAAPPPPAPAPPAPGSRPPESGGLTNGADTPAHALLHREVSPGPRAGRRRRGPLTFDQARAEAEEALHRDVLLDLFFDYARQFFDYAVLFLVQADIAEGRDAFGSGASRDRVLGIGVPLDLPSLLATAREKRAPVLAVAPSDGLDAVLLADLHRPPQSEVAVIPLLVRTRAVAILVGDCGDAGIDRDSVRQVVAFGSVAGKAFERIIVRRKLDGFIAGSAVAGAALPESPAIDFKPRSSAVAVPAHLPPVAQAATDTGLPLVMVDIAVELGTLLDHLVAGEPDEAAEFELLRQGARAMPVLMARFPGPVTFDRSLIATTPNPPRASECGVVLRLVARERRVALPFVLERLDDPDPERRGWATHLLGELPYVEALPGLVERLLDADGAIGVSAAIAIGAVARNQPGGIVSFVRDLAGEVDPLRRRAAMLAACEVRDPELVPILVRALGDETEEVAQAAHAALVQVTRHDLGLDARTWQKWWDQNAGRHRLEWLIDALTHDDAAIRRAAGDELRLISRQYFGFSSDLPPRDRERAQQRYRDWWITEGRAIHRRP
ncbi:MAG: hypothetical protein FWD17_06010 [Polyangiaceae bacterium]|nr:hypothetical protein [Polyangiaceae bacterium]